MKVIKKADAQHIAAFEMNELRILRVSLISSEEDMRMGVATNQHNKNIVRNYRE